MAPATQQSAVGRSMTLFEPLRISKHSVDGIMLHGVSGTPTDAVIIGMFVIMDRMPDLVISGVNIGENLSAESVTTSGTIGAALEAANHDIPAIAVSMRVEDEGDKFMDTNYKRDYSPAIKVINRIALSVLQGKLPEGADVLNVNIPSRVKPDTEIVVTELARKMYRTHVHHRQDPRGRSYYWIDGEVIMDAADNTDLRVVMKEAKVSVTPLSLDMTARVNVKKVKEMLGLGDTISTTS